MLKKDIREALKERILILDGGLGTMVQGFGLVEADYRGERFAGWDIPLEGCNDILSLTAPHVLRKIHEAYFAAGADIVSTCSFNANGISLADYGLQEYVYEINREAAKAARFVADGFTMRNPSKPRYVAGSVGPTSRTASMSADVNDPASRAVTFDELKDAYAEQVRGLLDGGADLIIVETIFDTLNAKAAVFAIEDEGERRGMYVPVMLSGTIADASGRTLSGQVVEAFYTSLVHAGPVSVGFNCALGAKQLLPYLERLSAVCEYAVSAHPNAGLPNLTGGYDETPETMADDVEEYMKRGLVNIVGGCCGTTPVHIEAIARRVQDYKPRRIPGKRHTSLLSGLEPLEISPANNFVNVGERANVAGSAKFARLIREGNYEEAVSVARQQVEAGAQIVDVCMDDGLIEGIPAMERFLNLAMSEPEIARVPFMIDSSSWEVLETGLKCVQGKSLVNSISLKEGEEEFRRRAAMIKKYGAAAVVMLFDEKGQADVYERKTEVALRAYGILTGMGFPPEDIVFDPNVLSVATGIAEHDVYGIDFIRAVKWIKGNLPYAKVSGGVSNLSFAFRGNNKVREAMHSVFLYHAVKAGMDMGIVNPAMLQVYSDIEPELLELCEDVVLNRRPDAAECLTAYAGKVSAEQSGQSNGTKEDAHLKWRDGSPGEKIEYAMTKGVTDHIAEDTMEAYEQLGSPLGVIDGMLMPAMAKIGELFGEGKMFLPQVVKSARVMKKAVDVLTPFIAQGDGSAGTDTQSKKILIATVKGDVHDIGKNIVSVVMSCNGYEVKDLGVMVECADIANAAQEWGADVIGLSGLISPSLAEMIKVLEELERRGLRTPVVVGGATTSGLHTAVKMAPVYSGSVIHSRDASGNISILNSLFGVRRDDYIAGVKEKQERLRKEFGEAGSGAGRLSFAEAVANRYIKPVTEIVPPARTGHIAFMDYPVAEAAKYIDWNFFFPAWGLKGRYPDILQSPEKGEEARKVFTDAMKMLGRMETEKLLTLNGVAGIYPAVSDGGDIVVDAGERGIFRLAQLRNQEKQPGQAGDTDGVQGRNLSLSDFVVPEETGESDYIGVFAVTAGIGLKELTKKYKAEGDDYSAILAKLLADRLTEAFAESVHLFLRRTLWGFEEVSAEPVAEDVIRGKYQGLRMAFGYPACPDHSLKKDVFELLGAAGVTGMRITENHMIEPGEALCGLIFANRDARYFSVGRIDGEQLADYAGRRGMSPEDMAKLIPQHVE